jgi:hypothetical protein
VILAADGNGDNIVDSADYNIWRAHFGQTAGSGVRASIKSSNSSRTAVPKAPSIVLAWLRAASLAMIARPIGHGNLS